MSRVLLLAGLLAIAAAAGAADPAAPYYSLQLSSNTSEQMARASLAEVRDLPGARIEKRGEYYTIRVGAWTTRAEATEALPDVRKRGYRDATVVRIVHTTRWIDPSPLDTPPAGVRGPRAAVGESAPPPAAATPVPPVVPPAPQTPAAAPPAPESLEIPPPSRDFPAAARALDWQVRKLIRTEGFARRDGYVYSLDIAWLMYYAALRADAGLYQALRPAVKPLVLDDPKDTFTQGFVLWRHRPGVAAEVTGAAEALHMARALWTGAKAFGLDQDRALALKIIEGYGRHAFEINDDWLVRKYYALDSQVFSNLSTIGGYMPDFLAEVEAAAPPTQPGPTLSERSYGVIERSVHERTGLLYPIVHPVVSQTYPGMDLEVYAPNNLMPVADACDAAEGAVRTRPRIAEKLLEFFHDEDTRSRIGYPYAYFDASSRKRVRRQIIGTPTLACMVRLADAVGDKDVRKWAFPLLMQEIQSLAAVPAVQEAPLFAAGPLLVAAYQLGAFRE